MTPTTKEIFETYEIRKTRKQKEAFTKWLRPILEQNGYRVKIDVGDMNCRNIVIGDPERADLIFAAHYDTCAVLPVPNFITPKAPLIYFLYQILLCIPIFAVLFGVAFVFRAVDPSLFMLGYWAGFLVLMGLMFFGPANKHTANDNTSGVTAIIDLALAMPEELRRKVAFVLFDYEESGLIGSGSFAKKYKSIRKDKLLVNLDCVSDGETILLCVKKRAKKLVPVLENAFLSTHTVEVEIVTKGYIYPSDQANFDCGVGVAALKKTKGGMLYMDKIHTGRDTVYREENISFLVDGCIRLTEMI